MCKRGRRLRRSGYGLSWGLGRKENRDEGGSRQWTRSWIGGLVRGVQVDVEGG